MIREANLNPTAEDCRKTIEPAGLVLVAFRPYEHKGTARVEIIGRKPRGRKLFYVVRYESGATSRPVDFWQDPESLDASFARP